MFFKKNLIFQTYTNIILRVLTNICKNLFGLINLLGILLNILKKNQFINIPININCYFIHTHKILQDLFSIANNSISTHFIAICSKNKSNHNTK